MLAIEYYGASELGFIGYRELNTVGDLDKGFIPVEDVEIQIQDTSSNIVYSNDTGIIWVKSEYLSLGYAFKKYTGFKKKASWATVEERGYLDQNNLLHLIGRSQNMIISGGNNIYPAEIESIIGSNYCIKNVCVLGIPDNYWGTMVCAIVQWQGNHKLSKIELKKYCNHFMEKYKFSKKIFEIKEFPLTSSGKIKLGEIIENVLNNSYLEIK